MDAGSHCIQAPTATPHGRTGGAVDAGSPPPSSHSTYSAAIACVSTHATAAGGFWTGFWPSPASVQPSVRLSVRLSVRPIRATHACWAKERCISSSNVSCLRVVGQVDDARCMFRHCFALEHLFATLFDPLNGGGVEVCRLARSRMACDCSYEI